MIEIKMYALNQFIIQFKRIRNGTVSSLDILRWFQEFVNVPDH